MVAFKCPLLIANICVTFLGERAVDNGGPHHEIFVTNGFTESYLDGPPYRRIWRHNTKFLDKLFAR